MASICISGTNRSTTALSWPTLLQKLGSADGLVISRHFSSKGKFQKNFKTTLGAHGPLVDGPDYTFLDGRPTPLGACKRQRSEEQLQLTSSAMQILSETKFAIENHKNKQLQQKLEREKKMNEKLKPKNSKTI